MSMFHDDGFNRDNYHLYEGLDRAKKEIAGIRRAAEGKGHQAACASSVNERTDGATMDCLFECDCVLSVLGMGR